MQTENVQRLFADLDAKHWDGRLQGGGWRCCLAPLQNICGRAVHNRKLIEIAEWQLNDPAEFRRTLLHEMIHAWLFLNSDPSHQTRNEGHGAAFAAELARLRSAGEDVASESEFVVCGDTSRVTGTLYHDRIVDEENGEVYPFHTFPIESFR